jgi:hypothetical protein
VKPTGYTAIPASADPPIHHFALRLNFILACTSRPPGSAAGLDRRQVPRVTHLFRELDVILRPDWIAFRVELKLDLRKLTVFRPSSIDLILTKMARRDDNDLQDVSFLLKEERLGAAELEGAIKNARVPDVPEIQELFNCACRNVLALAAEQNE